jgi:hypothetical protein
MLDLILVHPVVMIPEAMVPEAIPHAPILIR